MDKELERRGQRFARHCDDFLLVVHSRRVGDRLPLPELDAWLRRRLRMCCWKQWRYVRTKVRALLKLGTPKKTAILTALSRKGPWHLSRTLATQTGMTNQWITDTLSLVSMRALWLSLHSPT